MLTAVWQLQDSPKLENKCLVNGSQMALDGLNATLKVDGDNNCVMPLGLL